MSIDGILNIHKPPGLTSFQVVSSIRRLCGEKKVGHAGTLDPDATGVLVICLGQGTRILEFLTNSAKTYRAEIELGITTDTYDSGGKITRKDDPGFVTLEDVQQALNSFYGTNEQIPPMYSATRYKGKHLYELARAGIEVERKPKTVVFYRLDFLHWDPPVFTIDVECSAGTYIRSLAHDIGQILGCGAHLKRLVRLKSNPFHIDDAISLSSFEDAFHQGYWQHFLYSIDEVILGWKAVILSAESEAIVKNGHSISLDLDQSSACSEGWCRAYSDDGRFLAVLRYDKENDLWHPDKFFQKYEPNS